MFLEMNDTLPTHGLLLVLVWYYCYDNILFDSFGVCHTEQAPAPPPLVKPKFKPILEPWISKNWLVGPNHGEAY